MLRLSHWSLVLCCLLLLSPAYGSNKTLFEGYYKIKANGVHVGYYIQRYELDTKNKEFISTYFLRTNQQGGNISESLKAYASQKLNPIKYQYTSLQGNQTKTIDANVRTDDKSRNILQVKVNENGKLRVYEKRLETGTFFSTFLTYMILQGKEGVKPGVKYKFKAIAEEDGKPYTGEVYIDSVHKKMGLDTYKTLLTFKRTQFVNFIDNQGESLISISPALGISAELVKNPAEATLNMKMNNKSISLLFGNMPKGTHHMLAEKEISGIVPPKITAPTQGLQQPKEKSTTLKTKISKENKNSPSSKQTTPEPAKKEDSQ